MTIQELITKAHAAAKAKGFWDTERNTGELLMLIVSECGEALEAHRKGMMINKRPLPTPEPPQEIQWRDCHADYEVSNAGDVRSKDMFVDNGNGGHIKPGQILRPGISGTGYRTVSLRGKTHKVARLVAEAFIDKPAGASVVNHINGTKTDDWFTNLEWITQAENNDHAFASGLRDMTKVFSWNDRASVLTDLNQMSVFDTAKKWNVHPSAIKRIRKEYGNLFSYFEYELADIVIRIADYLGRQQYTPLQAETKKVTRPVMNVGDALWRVNKVLVLEMNVAMEWAIHGVFAIADDQGIDLWRHIELKLAYNETRPRLHGKSY